MAKVKEAKPMKNLTLIIIIFGLGILAGLFFSERQTVQDQETAGQTIGRLIDKGLHKVGDGIGEAGAKAGTQATGWLGTKLERMGSEVKQEEIVTPPAPVDPTPSAE